MGPKDFHLTQVPDDANAAGPGHALRSAAVEKEQVRWRTIPGLELSPRHDHHPSQQRAGRQRRLGGVEGELGELMEGLCWFSVKQEVRSSQ